ncbi:MAG: prolipoprotein diacylglyceryl transferase family protein [Telluria sp.]
MDAINIGPLSLPIPLLATFGALMASTFVGKRVGRALGVDVESTLWLVALYAMLVARAAFVASYADLYLAAPLDILDIRDGGFSAPAGIAATLVAGAWLSWRRPGMRKPLLAGIGAGTAVLLLGAALMLAPRGKPPIPDLALSGLDGRTMQLASLAGKPVVINLWASWCPPCRREMPVLRQAQINHPEIVFVFANQGETADTVRKYMAAERIALENVLLDSNGQIGALTSSGALPTTLFYNAQGHLVERRLGELSAATLAQRLESLRAAPAKE